MRSPRSSPFSFSHSGIGDRLLSAASEISSSSTDITDLDPSLSAGCHPGSPG